ncbi:MAG: DUF3800 domain-containing protein [Elusimicrobiota bacterium]|jgi:hypothetical protein|nr:DUF3800 domain-containing protein [Elusimicrobiota bacterium]
MYIYLDESGDLGFDFKNKKPSRFFTICCVVIKKDEDRNFILKRIKRILKNISKKRKIIEEIKAIETNLRTKIKLYNKIKDINFEIYSIIIKKQNIKVLQKADILYNYFVEMILQDIIFDDFTTFIFR